jgi:HEAT repeat protein
MKKMSKKTREALYSLLNTEETDIGTVAAADMFGEEGKQILLNVAAGTRKGFSSQQRARAVYLLGLLRWEKATKPIIQLIASKDQSIRVHALYALGLIGGNNAISSLVKNMRNPKTGPIEKAHILHILGEIGDKSVEREIRDFISKERDISLRLEAERAIINIGNKEEVNTSNKEHI